MTPFIIAPDADGEVAVWDNTDPEKPVPVLWRPYVQHDDLWNLIVAAIPAAEPTGLGAVVRDGQPDPMTYVAAHPHDGRPGALRWWAEDGTIQRWSDIPQPVTVLNEGWEGDEWSQWLAASRMVTSGMVAAPVDEPPAPQPSTATTRKCAEEDR